MPTSNDAGSNQGGRRRVWSEQTEVAGANLVSKIKELYREGKVRRVIIRDERGRTMLTIPMNAGVVVGGIVVLSSPLLAAVGAIAGLVANVRLEIVRDDVPPPSDGSGGSGGYGSPPAPR